MISVTLQLDRTEYIGAATRALRTQAAALRAQADALVDLAEQFSAAGEQAVIAMLSAPQTPPAPQLPDPQGLAPIGPAEAALRITTGEAPVRAANGGIMSPDEEDRIVRAHLPQPGPGLPAVAPVAPTIPPEAPAPPTAAADDDLGHHELIDI